MTKATSNGFEGVKPVSSQIGFAGYDPAKQELRVEFLNGGAYHYHGVPMQEWEGMQQAESMGRYLAQEIKGKYQHEKKDVPPPKQETAEGDK